MMVSPFQSTAFSDALVILGAAGLVIPAFARARVNPVIGFLLVGIIAGPSGLGSLVSEVPSLRHVTISRPEAIAPFAEFGIILLLFTIGLELSFRRLWSLRRLLLGVGASELIFGAAAIALALHLFGLGWQVAIALGLALALSSTAIVLPLVGTTSPVGKRAFSMLMFEDVALVPIIFALAALAPYGDTDSLDGLMRTLLLGSAVIGAMLLLGRYVLPPLFAQAARTKSPELFLSASLLVVILASIATTSVGLSPIVGALVAGILIAETDYQSEVESIIEPFKGLALGVFLITVGMSLDLARIVKDWPMLIGALVGIAAIKTIVTALLLRAARSRDGVAWETALLMASPSETSLIVLGAALQAGLIGASTAEFWQIVTAMGLTITPLLAILGRQLGRRIDRHGAEIANEAEPESGHTVIIGFGRVGRLVAQLLVAHGRRYRAYDADPDTVERSRKRGFEVRFADAARPRMLDRLGLDRAAAVVLTMDDPVQLGRLVRRIRKHYPNLAILARARDTDHAAELYRAGVTEAVPETLESSLQLSESVLVELGVAMGPVIASIHEKRGQLRARIMRMAELEREPRLRRRRAEDV